MKITSDKKNIESNVIALHNEFVEFTSFLQKKDPKLNFNDILCAFVFFKLADLEIQVDQLKIR